MTLAESLTPNNTEEVKPGLFIQQRGKGYRVVHPVAWDGKINWKRFILGHNFWKNLFIFLLILFICYGYYHDKQLCYDIIENPKEFCEESFPKGITDNIGGNLIDDENNYTISSDP